MRTTASLMVLLTIALGGEAEAQVVQTPGRLEATARTVLVGRALVARAAWLADTTKADGCSIAAITGDEGFWEHRNAQQRALVRVEPDSACRGRKPDGVKRLLVRRVSDWMGSDSTGTLRAEIEFNRTNFPDGESAQIVTLGREGFLSLLVRQPQYYRDRVERPAGRNH